MNKKFAFIICFIAAFLVLNGLPEKVHGEGADENLKSDEVVVISNPKTPALKIRLVFKEELSIGEVEGDENSKHLFWTMGCSRYSYSLITAKPIVWR